MSVDYLSEVDFFRHTSENKDLRRECYRIFTIRDIKKLVYQGYGTLSSTVAYPFMTITFQHKDRMSAYIEEEILNYIDKYTLMIRLLYTTTLKVPFLYFCINETQYYHSTALLNIYDTSMILPQDMELSQPVKFNRIINFYFLLNSPVFEELGSLYLNQFFYQFTDCRLTLSIQIMFIEKILSVYMQDFEFKGGTNRKRVENLLNKLQIDDEYQNNLSIAYDIRNEFLHGDLKRSKRLEREIKQIAKDNNISPCLYLRKRLVELIVSMFMSEENIYET